MRTLLIATSIVAIIGSRSHGTVRSSGGALAETDSAATVTIHTFQFAPDTVRVRVGTRVTWTNADEIEHTITSDTPDSPTARFNGVVAKRGATYSAVLSQAGTYRYFCDRHRFMTGTVIVKP